MRYLYQQILSFLLIIIVTIITMGWALLSFSEQQVYWREEERLKDVAKFIADQSISPEYLAAVENVLASANIRIYYYNAKNERVYPNTLNDKQEVVELPAALLNNLRNGKSSGLEPFDMGFSQQQLDSLSIFVPVHGEQTGDYVGFIVIGAAAADAHRVITDLRVNVLKGFIISGLVSLFLGFGLARYQNTRINRLRKATRRIAEGDYTIQLAEKENGDEFDDLAKDFNVMIQSLAASNEEIERQENIRRQLMMDVAHEMRTPLTTMNGLVEGLRYKIFPEEKIDRSLELIHNETQRLTRLVNENLDYEKIRAQEISLNKITFNLHDTLDAIRIQLKANAAKKHNKIFIDCPEDLTVYADPDRFRQIIVNISQNAIQFTEAGEIYWHAEKTETGTQISIKDTGIGMNKEQVENIWERFYKADISRKNNEFGESGLGLAIVKQLVVQHQATIEVESETDIGTIFTLHFKDAVQFLPPSAAEEDKNEDENENK